jgi:hypothetical protein
VSRAARLVVAAIASGIGGGAVAGLGARLAMYAMRRMNGSHNGEMTHAGATVGRWTAGGTRDLVLLGVVNGAGGGLVYLLLRRLLPGRSLVRGLLYGVLLLALVGGIFLDDQDSYEYVRYVSPAISVTAFAALFPLFGVTVAAIAEAIAPAPAAGPARWRRLAVVAGRALLVLVAVLGARATGLRLYRAYGT